MAFNPGGYGSELYGDPFGAGGPLHVVRARAMGSQIVRIVFDEEPVHVSPAGTEDALNPANYVVSVASGQAEAPLPVGVGTEVFAYPAAAVAAGDERALDVHVDRPMVIGVGYRITARNIRSALGGALGAPVSATFGGIALVKEVVAPHQKRPDLTDFASRPFEGALLIDASGDIAVQGGAEGLRKRILRRLATPLGAFSFLPGYGVGVRLKFPVSSRLLGSMKADIQRQVALEPEVTAVGVEVSLAAGQVLTVTVHAQTKAGAVDVEQSFQPGPVVIPV